ncbi:hypothetical protein [Devosia sp. 2618]|uniref:hypothetical protein n=1 Tax=Devosia sp. 2618 TaxID=3156454 RepID=UPI00339161FC
MTMIDERPVLIVEEQLLIALDIQRMLETLGASKMLIVGNAEAALQQRDAWPDFALAVIEVRSDLSQICALMDALSAIDVPVTLITTARTANGRLPGRADLLALSKPISEELLASTVAEALAKNVRTSGSVS